MGRRMIRAAGVAMLAAAPSFGQAPAPSCPASPVAPPAELTGWSNPSAVAASPAGDTASAIRPGIAYDVTLLPGSQVHYPVMPRHMGAPEGSGGIVKVTVASAGTYRVALGGGGWIDLVDGMKAVPATGHGHGPECSGIRKLVDFALKPGTYLVSLADIAKPAVTLMIVRR